MADLTQEAAVTEALARAGVTADEAPRVSSEILRRHHEAGLPPAVVADLYGHATAVFGEQDYPGPIVTFIAHVAFRARQAAYDDGGTPEPPDAARPGDRDSVALAGVTDGSRDD